MSSCWPNSHATVLSTERLHKGSKYAACPVLSCPGATHEGGQENSIAIHIWAIRSCSQGQELNTRQPPAVPSLLLRHMAPAWEDTTATGTNWDWERSKLHFRDVLGPDNPTRHWVQRGAGVPDTCTVHGRFEKRYLRTSPSTGPHRLESHFSPLAWRNSSGAVSLCTVTAIATGANRALGFAVLGYTIPCNNFLAPFLPPS